MINKKSIVGSIIAFVLATSCCWLPALIITLGGGSALLALSNSFEKFSPLFIMIGIGFLAFGIRQYYMNNNRRHKDIEAILQSIITCPECGNRQEETMPTNACQYFYECTNCGEVLKPLANDCCVYCSYGTVPCPPIQMDESCC